MVVSQEKLSIHAPVLVYGGTFDPVHAGHVAVARAAADALAAAEVRLLPCGDPPHRAAPQAQAQARAQMLRLAFAEDSRFVVDERELHRAGKSYSVDSLRELRAEFGPQRPLVLLLGADAAAGLEGWWQPTALPTLANLLVFARPGVELPAAAMAVGFRPVASIDRLCAQPAGGVFEVQIPLSAASSTGIRAALKAGESQPEGLPAAVAAWLQAHPVYRPGVC